MMNKIMSIGRLTADPETRDVNGKTCVNFTLASDNRMKDAEGKNCTNFYSCTAWGKQGELIAQYCHKGDRLGIVGDLSVRRYKDTNGIERTAIQVTITDMEFLMSKPQGNNTSAANPAPAAHNTGYVPVENVDLPF